MNLILNISVSATSVTESTMRTLSVLGTCLLLPRPSSLSAVTETHMLYFLCNVVLVPEKISIIVLWTLPGEHTLSPSHAYWSILYSSHVYRRGSINSNRDRLSEWLWYYFLGFESVLRTWRAAMCQVCLRVVLKPWNREFELWFFCKL